MPINPNEVQWDEPQSINPNEVQWDSAPVESQKSRKDSILEHLSKPQQSVFGGAARAAGQGLTFGWGDEIVAGAGAGLAKAFGDKTPYRDIYSGMKQSIIERQKDFAETNPAVSTGAEIAGAVLPAFLTMGAAAPAATAKLLPTMARGAGIGAAQGAAYGAGTGEGIKDSAKKAAVGGSLGFVAGGLLPAAGSAIGKTKNVIANTFFQNADEKSARIIRDAAEQAGITPDDFVMKYTELGEGAIAADVDENLLKQAKVALNRFSTAKNAAREFVDTRQTKQQSDLLKSLSKHMGGTKSDDIYAALEKNQMQRAEQASPLYKAAFDSDIDPSAFADKRIRNQGIQDALKEAEDYALADVNRGGIPPKPVEKWHYAKKVLWDKAQALRATNPEKARLIDSQRKVVDDVLNTIPEYKQARTIWADSMDREAASELGKGFIKANPREFAREFSKLTDSEREFAKMSAINDLANSFGAKSENRSVYQMLTDVPNARENLKTVLGSQEALDSFLKESKRWQAFGRTRKEFNQSTITQPLMSAEAQMGEIADAVSSPVRSAVMRSLKKHFSNGMDADTANALATKLTTPNLTSDQARKLIEGTAKSSSTKNALAAPIYTIQVGGALSNQ